MKDPGLRSAFYSALAAVDQPCYVVREGPDMTATNEEPPDGLLGFASPVDPEQLGSAEFRSDHGLRYAYMAGAMANGIASAPFVAALAKSGCLASFGAAGLGPDRIGEALTAIEQAAPGLPFACNLIHSPAARDRERQTVQLYLQRGVRCVEASAYADLTPELVWYRLAGLGRDTSGRVRALNRIVAKVSRTQIAERFLLPAPHAIVGDLLDRGLITAEQAALAPQVPMADDLTAEADSGGHTDRRPMTVLLPELIQLRDRVHATQRYAQQVRVGAAGGIGTPAAARAAFALGAAYIVTGSINQASVEAGQSEAAKLLLSEAGTADCAMAPSADMFELGAEVQVLKRGTRFAANARRLHDLYRRHAGLDEIPAAERTSLEERVFMQPLGDVWAETVRYLEEHSPDQLVLARDHPKRRMALVFRWYLGLASAWSVLGDADRVADYQLWCGPAMGAFNAWADSTYLQPLENRFAARIAEHLMMGVAFMARVDQLRLAGIQPPADCSAYVPVPAEDRQPVAG